MKVFTRFSFSLCAAFWVSNAQIIAHEDNKVPVSSHYFVNAPLLLAENKSLEPDKIDLSAKILEKRKVKVSWITPAAYKASTFVVQRSRDLKYFEDVASADANFDPAQKSLYTFTDQETNKGLYYYRVIEYQEDGTIKISEPIAIKVA